MADSLVSPVAALAPAQDAHTPAHPHLKSLVDAAKACGPLRVAIAYPCDAASLGAAIEAARAGLIAPLLVGPTARMQAAATEGGLDLSGLAQGGQHELQRFGQTTLPELNALLMQINDMAAVLQRLAELLEQNPRALLLGKPSGKPGPGD